MKPARVLTAQPFRYGAMGSLGDAMYMLLGQSRYPDTVDPRDRFHNADHDRLYSWDHVHTEKCFNELYAETGIRFEEWATRADHDRMLAFLIEVLKADRAVEWTGWRVLGSVHRGNGYPVYSLSLFAKHPDSSTEVYSGHDAPNVEGGWDLDIVDVASGGRIRRRLH